MPETIDRRRVLLGALALGVGAPLLDGRAARAAPLVLGDMAISVLSDGNLILPMSFAFPDVPTQDLTALLKANDLPLDALRPDCNVTLVESGARRILIDAGAGANFMASAGKLPASLAQAGIDPETISDVVLTHAHPDHLWGLTDDFDDPAFANATVRICRAEWDFWRAEGMLAAMPEARKSFVVGARNRFDAVEGMIEFFDAGGEILPGLEAVDTKGHTPGHVSVALHAGSDSLVVLGDAITNHVVSFARPDWPSGADQDPARGAATRAILLDRLAADKARVIGFHLPYPGTGRVEVRDGAYRFDPQT